MTTTELVWLAIGLTGQALFSMRFLVQWLQSERNKRSVVPVEFWYFSVAGGLTLLTYAIYKRDPVFIIGQLTGLFIYSRNLFFIRRERAESDAAPRGLPLFGVTVRFALLWGGAWLLVVCSSLLTHPLLPIDETRYVSVAWEMWLRDDFLTPFLNGEPYSHKPPFLFWLIHLGWWLFGVNDWWPRLAPALFALAALFLTRYLARRLWPEQPAAALIAPTLLTGCLLWALFTPMIMFDVILAVWVMLAILGLVLAAGGAARGGWALFAAALAVGGLVKGPVVLLHTLPAALLAPYWHPAPRPHWRHWYGALGLAVCAALALAMTWAVPAALHGGERYAQAILWGQTAGRVVESFAHQRPWWWYLPLLPVLLFPWAFWPTLWRALRIGWREHGVDWPLRLCLAWAVPPLLGFSLISGKQVHYLIPLLPALALFAARALATTPLGARGMDQWPIGAALTAVALLMWLLPALQARHDWPAWIARISPLAAAALVAGGLLLILPLRGAGRAGRTAIIAAAALVLSVIVKSAVIVPALPYYDLRELSYYLQQEQDRGAAIANLGTYHDEFHFFGRLKQQIDVVDIAQAVAWGRAHPDGRLVTYGRHETPLIGVTPKYRQPYRDRWIAVWSGRDIADHPEVLDGS